MSSLLDEYSRSCCAAVQAYMAAVKLVDMKVLDLIAQGAACERICARTRA